MIYYFGMIVVAAVRMTSSSIYGDGVLFSEDIREVFAMPHHEKYCIHVFCRAGSASIGMNHEDIVLHAHECLICQPKSVVRYCKPTEDFCCFIVSVQQQAHREILDHVLRYEQDYYAKRMFIIHHPVLSISPYLRQRLRYYAALFKQIISSPPPPPYKQRLKADYICENWLIRCA